MTDIGIENGMRIGRCHIADDLCRLSPAITSNCGMFEKPFGGVPAVYVASVLVNSMRLLGSSWLTTSRNESLESESLRAR